LVVNLLEKINKATVSSYPEEVMLMRKAQIQTIVLILVLAVAAAGMYFMFKGVGMATGPRTDGLEEKVGDVLINVQSGNPFEFKIGTPYKVQLAGHASLINLQVYLSSNNFVKVWFDGVEYTINRGGAAQFDGVVVKYLAGNDKKARFVFNLAKQQLVFTAEPGKLVKLPTDVLVNLLFPFIPYGELKASVQISDAYSNRVTVTVNGQVQEVRYGQPFSFMIKSDDGSELYVNAKLSAPKNNKVGFTLISIGPAANIPTGASVPPSSAGGSNGVQATIPVFEYPNPIAAQSGSVAPGSAGSGFGGGVNGIEVPTIDLTKERIQRITNIRANSNFNVITSQVHSFLTISAIADIGVLGSVNTQGLLFPFVSSFQSNTPTPNFDLRFTKDVYDKVEMVIEYPPSELPPVVPGPQGAGPLFGDYNYDSQVDAADYVIIKENFGRTDAQPTQGDSNSDRRVDGSDFDIWKANFGTGG